MLEAAITPKTKAFVLNSPSNPTGLVYTEEELRAFGEVCVKHDVWIVSDEMYERMVYGGTKHVSIASLSQDFYDRTITINGLSKAYAMTGWRLGYAAGPIEIIKAMSTVQSHLASAPTTFAQCAAIEALENGEEAIQPMLKAFEERNLRMYELLSQIDGIVCQRPMGAFYMFPNISAFGMKSRDFAAKLIEEKHVAAVPGVSFGSRDNLRFSYACSLEEIEEGMRRFKEFCDSIKR
jgi:aspartate aminotransferase